MEKVTIKTESQKDMILRYLKERGTITQNEAFAYFACTRLASRICDLKKEGYNISSTWKSAKNRYGVVCSFKEYRLEE